MTALTHVENAWRQTLEGMDGIVRVVTAPFMENRSTPDELDRFVREQVGTILDGMLVIPSTAVLYWLLTRSEERSGAMRAGEGVALGTMVFTASAILRRVVL